MSIRKPRLLVVFGLLLLGACQPVTVQTGNGGSVPVAVRVDDAAYWLEEWHRVSGLPEQDLVQALESRQRDFADDPGPRSRLRLALLLAEGPRPVRDQSQALALLKQLEEEKASASARALAALLTQVIGEQHWAHDKLKEMRDGLKQSEIRIEELERQLQAVTDIEQSIQKRE